MDELKKTVRGLTNRGRKAGREIDGHTVKDEVGNAGDDARMHIANAEDDAKAAARRSRDRAHEHAHETSREATRKSEETRRRP